ncbi:hypothetical protein D3C78_1603170 [compost metagenome]
MSLNREQVVVEVKQACMKYSISQAGFVVGYGAAMVMHGLRETTSDIDADVTAGTFNRYKNRYETGMGLTGAYVKLTNNIDIHVMDAKIEWELIDGIRVYTLKQLAKSYEAFMNHPDRNPAKRGQDQATLDKIYALIK